MFLKISQNSQEKHLCQSPQTCNFIKKEILAQVFFCQFCKIFKNIFFIEHVCATASGDCEMQKHFQKLIF